MSKSSIVLEYDSRKACAIASYGKYIDSLIAKKQKIPARLLTQFFSFFKVSKASVNSDVIKRLEKNKFALIEHFGKDKQYTFKYKHYNRDFSFQKMVDYVFSELERLYVPLWERTQIKNRKLELAKTIYNIFNEYRTTYLNTKYRKHISYYKICAMTAFIMNGIGFSIGGKKPNNHSLFDGAYKILGKEIKQKKKLVSGLQLDIITFPSDFKMPQTE